MTGVFYLLARELVDDLVAGARAADESRASEIADTYLRMAYDAEVCLFGERYLVMMVREGWSEEEH
jgi:hypothetical protein